MGFLEFFSVQHTFISVLGYRLSYLELAGTLLSLCSVWLATRNHILNWPVGNVAVILFAVLFFQIQLYSDFVEQIYFLVTGSYGWWVWHSGSKAGGAEADDQLRITRNTARGNLLCGAVIISGTLILGHLMAHIHEQVPRLFPQPAAYPYVDAFSTVMSFAANFLMVHRKIECWHLWIAVDVIGVGLYFSRGILFVTLLYLIFLALATWGLLRWREEWIELQPGMSPLPIS